MFCPLGPNGSLLRLWLVSGLLTCCWTPFCPAVVLLSPYHSVFFFQLAQPEPVCSACPQTDFIGHFARPTPQLKSAMPSYSLNSVRSPEGNILKRSVFLCEHAWFLWLRWFGWVEKRRFLKTMLNRPCICPGAGSVCVEEDFGRAWLAQMHVRTGSEKMNCSILECYIVGNVGLRRTLINLCFSSNKWQICI